MTVQLLYFDGCPNVEAAREVLRRTLVEAGRPPSFDEVDVTAPDAPEALRGWGSPTILVGGRDVAGALAPSGTACRLYPGTDGRLSGVPPEASVREALRRGGDLDCR